MNIQIPQSAIAPFLPILGFPYSIDQSQYDEIKAAICEKYEAFLWNCHYHMMPVDKVPGEDIRQIAKRILYDAADSAGATKIHVRASGDGIMTPINYVTTFETDAGYPYTIRVIQHLD